jgi:hypothetical protein
MYDDDDHEKDYDGDNAVDNLNNFSSYNHSKGTDHKDDDDPRDDNCQGSHIFWSLPRDRSPAHQRSADDRYGCVDLLYH